MKVQLLKLDEKNLNGRIYSTVEIEKAISQIKDGGVFGVNGAQETPFIDVSKISMSAKNLRVEDGYLVADVKVLDTPAGKELQLMLDDVEFRPSGYGRVNEDGTLSDYTLLSISAVKKGTGA